MSGSAIEHVSGTNTLRSAPDRVRFTGCLEKAKTADPRATGAAEYLTNLSGREYRLVHLEYEFRAEGLRAGEWGDTDIGITVLPENQAVSLNSGEEIFATHVYSASSADRRSVQLLFPAGGIPLRSKFRLSVGSSSSVQPAGGGGALEVGGERLRNRPFLPLCYTADLTRSDLVGGPPMVSYRSPLRDRSYVADPARIAAPMTRFRNTSARPVKVEAMVIFVSNITGAHPSDHMVDVLVDGQRIRRLALPRHRPGRTSESAPIIIPTLFAVQPGQTLEVQGLVLPTRAVIFDFAAYVFAGIGLSPIGERSLRADVNGDGQADAIDIDDRGSVWVGLTDRFGLQNTQGEWARSIRNVSSVMPLVPRSGASVLRVTNEAGLCLQLKADPSRLRFLPDYCRGPGRPSAPEAIWGDFNGDGWIDRMQVAPTKLTYFVALGGKDGLGSQRPWVVGYGSVERMFVWDVNGDGRDDIEAEWSEAGRFFCVVWKSSGQSFEKANC